MEEHRQLEIAEAGLVGIRPQKFVRRSEDALQHEAILNQPALQILTLERIVVISYGA